MVLFFFEFQYQCQSSVKRAIWNDYKLENRFEKGRESKLEGGIIISDVSSILLLVRVINIHCNAAEQRILENKQILAILSICFLPCIDHCCAVHSFAHNFLITSILDMSIEDTNTQT